MPTVFHGQPSFFTQNTSGERTTKSATASLRSQNVVKQFQMLEDYLLAGDAVTDFMDVSAKLKSAIIPFGRFRQL